MDKPENILICRTDLIGDVVLTLPLFQAARAAFPHASIAALVSTAAAPVLKENSDIDIIIVDREEDIHRGPAGFLRLTKEIKGHGFDTALLPYCNWRLASLAVSANIKRRVGNGFRAYLPLINQPVWIHRRHPPMHESRYAMAFLKPLGIDPPSPGRPGITVTDDERTTILKFLEKQGIADNEPLVGIFPGSGGSAFNMSPDRWVTLGKATAKALGARKILLMGTSAEQTLIERMSAALGDLAVPLAGELDLRLCCALQEQLALFLAPNSGLLHTAAAVGTPVIGFFPPLVSLSARKWAPLGDNVAIVGPEHEDCPKCVKHECKWYPCMDSISERNVLKRLADLSL